jgi:sugar phosphate permease
MAFVMKLIKNKIIRSAYLAWFAIALFYLYQYILRVAPGVMVEEIRTTFKITAEQFATLGALYLLGYSLLQIPLGIIVDRIGVKKMCLYSITICIIGSLLFGVTKHFWVAQLARFIIGVGSASAFMCALKFIADHFPPGNRGFLMGATLALGTVGALVQGHSTKYLYGNIEWHDVVTTTAAIGVSVFVLISLLVKSEKQDYYATATKKSSKEIWASILKIMSSRNIMIYAILAVGLYTPLSALADLWGTAFIKQKYGLHKSDAAQISLLMYIGLTIGSLILPWISEKLNKLDEAIIFCSLGILIIFGIILYLPPFDHFTLSLLLITLGFFCGAEMMCFTGALNHSQKHDSGEIIGVVNTLNMLGGAILQQIIGWGLDVQWDGTFDQNHLRHYTTSHFENSLSILTVVIFLSCLFSLSLLKKHRKKSK